MDEISIYMGFRILYCELEAAYYAQDEAGRLVSPNFGSTEEVRTWVDGVWDRVADDVLKEVLHDS